MKPAGNGIGKLNGTRPNGAAIAVLHSQEGVWRLLIARKRDRWEVVESRTLQGVDPAALTPVFEQHGVTQVVRVVPGRETVARCVQVPAGDDGAMVGAVSLQAEVELPSTLPFYRRAGGLLPGPMDAEMRTALLTGWMGGGAKAARVGVLPEAWVTPVAALAMLRGEAGRGAVYCEASQGLICVIVPGPEKTVARVLVDAPGDDESWHGRVAQAVEETGQMASVTPTSLGLFNTAWRGGTSKRVLLDAGSLASVKARISGVREDAGWLDDYGIALGAVLVAGSELASVRSLATLHMEQPREAMTSVQAGLAWLSRPRNGWMVTAAAVALVMLVPMGMAWGRMKVMRSRTEALKDLKVGFEGLDKKAAMYSQLETMRLPMTKLMADISSALPVGVELSQLTISAGQTPPVLITGTAKDFETLSKLEQNLNSTQVLGNVDFKRRDAKEGGSGVDFELRVDVKRAHVVQKLTEETDFRTKPLAVRLYGDGASNTAAPAAHDGESGHADRSSRRRPDRSESSGNGDKAESGEKGDRESRRPVTKDTSGPPAPLTDAEIAKMDKSTAMKEWTSRQAYVQKNPNLDSATKQRLKDEAAKSKEQMTKAPAAAKPAEGGKP